MPTQPPPDLGEHTAAVLKSAGVDPAEYERAAASSGAVATPHRTRSPGLRSLPMTDTVERLNFITVSSTSDSSNALTDCSR